ncbi:unnamed protein product [Cladocopium goreaui]|uniref:Cys-loop ligand-gated ion channel n=1 Tax=Cladocopium goreaui TaxID=2562237 RepID=A0A9P1GPD8_9DINO|nr:unnamed protein product [Cladocopium goreaui]
MAVSPTKKHGKTTYYFEVRVNLDKLMAIDQQNESFKAQVFLEATLRYPPQVCDDDDADVLTIFQRATVENSLAKPEDDGHPELKFQRATKNSLAKWDIWEENGRPKLAMRRQDPVRKAPLQFVWLIHGEFGEELELQNFPFDVQDLTVMIRFGWPCKDDRVQVRFIDAGKSEVFLNVFCLKNAWTQPEAVDVQFGFTKTKGEKLEQFPLIRIRCQVGRKPKFYLVNVILPVASIVLASAKDQLQHHAGLVRPCLLGLSTGDGLGELFCEGKPTQGLRHFQCALWCLQRGVCSACSLHLQLRATALEKSA